jgi:hypothetical protein
MSKRSLGRQATGQSSIWTVIILLIVSAMLLQNGYQTYQIIDDGDRLKARIAAQQPTVNDAQKVRAQLLSIGGQTAALAEGDNINAQIIIERLRAQGVTIRPPS